LKSIIPSWATETYDDSINQTTSVTPCPLATEPVGLHPLLHLNRIRKHALLDTTILFLFTCFGSPRFRTSRETHAKIEANDYECADWGMVYPTSASIFFD